MKTHVVVGTIVLALSLLLIGAAQAGDAQQENPLFLEAKDMAERLDNSSLNDNAKLHWRQRFQALAEEQERLWALAGQVDGGQCKDSCIDLYNGRVEQWQNALNDFNKGAGATLRQIQTSDPVLVKKCVDKAYADREKCYQKGRDTPGVDLNAWTQKCWDKSVEVANECYK